MSDDPAIKKRVAKFQNAANKRMKVLQSSKASSDKRIIAAKWLGESGYDEAIPLLVDVYTDLKASNSDDDLLDAVTYALGQFQALREELGLGPDDSFQSALDDPTNEPVVDRVNNIIVKGKFGKPKKTSAGTLWGVAGVMLVSMVLLGVMGLVVGGGDTDTAPEPTAIPPTVESTPEATPELDAQGTPLPTATNTPTPTPTIAPSEVEPYVRAMNDAITQITEPRGPVELLAQFWQDAADTGQTNGCNELRPEIPSSVFVEEYYLNNIAGLREAQTNVNIALGQLNNGWDLFYTSCEEGTLLEQSTLGLQLMDNLNNAIAGAQVLLRDLQQYRS
jgi:hypothetical protein